MGTGERLSWNLALVIGLALLTAFPHAGLGALGFALMVVALAGYLWRGRYWRIHREEVMRRRALRGWRALMKYSPEWVEQATAAVAEKQEREATPPTAPTPPSTPIRYWAASPDAPQAVELPRSSPESAGRRSWRPRSRR